MSAWLGKPHLWGLTVALVALASCGGGGDTAEDPEPLGTEPPETAGEPTPPETQPDPPTPGEAETSSEAPEGPPVEECKEPAAEIEIGSDVSGTVDD